MFVFQLVLCLILKHLVRSERGLESYLERFERIQQHSLLVAQQQALYGGKTHRDQNLTPGGLVLQTDSHPSIEILAVQGYVQMSYFSDAACQGVKTEMSGFQSDFCNLNGNGGSYKIQFDDGNSLFFFWRFFSSLFHFSKVYKHPYCQLF